MIVPFVDSFALAISPWPIFVVALLVVGLFAPQLLPKIGRALGRLVRAEAFRRIGLSNVLGRVAKPQQGRRTVVEPAPAVEIIMPQSQDSTLRAGSENSLAAAPVRQRAMPIWLVTLVVFAVAGTIGWLLLHSR